MCVAAVGPLPLPPVHTVPHVVCTPPCRCPSIFFCPTALAFLGLLRLDEPRGLRSNRSDEIARRVERIEARKKLIFNCIVIYHNLHFPTKNLTTIVKRKTKNRRVRKIISQNLFSSRASVCREGGGSLLLMPISRII